MQTYKIPHIISRTVTNYDDNNVTINTITRGKPLPVHYPWEEDIVNILSGSIIMADEEWLASFKSWALQPLDDLTYVTIINTCTAWEECYSHKACLLEELTYDGTFMER
tara:strand:- start:811 stop:1137 length:327 start_codon:yes stop_codon:yes gene_type:complete